MHPGPMTPPSPSVDLDARRRPTELRMASLPAARRVVRFHHWIRMLSPGPPSRTSSPAVHEDLAGRVPADGDRVVQGIPEDGTGARAGQERGGEGREDPLDEGLDLRSARAM